jgi:hypothetical protein
MTYTLSGIAGIIISAAMLRDRDFGKVVAWVGILGNALVILPFVPAGMVALVIAIGGLFLVV